MKTQQPPTPSPRRKKEIGQSMAEVAIALPLLLTIMMGLFDLGRMYYQYIALEDAAGEGAIFLSLEPDCKTSADCADPNNATYRINNAISGVLNSPINVVSLNAGSTIGAPVEVQISTTFNLVTPILPITQLTLTATANQTVIKN